MIQRLVLLLCAMAHSPMFVWAAPAPTSIILNAKIITADAKFQIVEAMALHNDKIIALGAKKTVMALAASETDILDMGGITILPGLIDSHVHIYGAAMHEFDHPIPPMEDIADLLKYVKARTQVVPKGEWISIRQVFITRLKEQRYPTKEELDRVAPDHPVVFSTGPDASVNSLALKLSGIDKDFKVTDGGAGYVEKDPKTQEPTGIIRSCTRYLKVKTSSRSASKEQKITRLLELLQDYHSVGLTGIIDRNCSTDVADLLSELNKNQQLHTRVSLSMGVGSSGSMENIQKSIDRIASHPLRKTDPTLQIIGIKMFLDGGMLTGSAYMRQPWGTSKIYSITDPQYRGLLFITPDRLEQIVHHTVKVGLQFTAHSVGDGAVHTLLDTYQKVNKVLPVAKTRPCLTHSNFMSKEAVQMCKELGVVVDIQPAWLYLDSHTLVKQFGRERLRYFQPLQSLMKAGVTVGGGSDHMQRVGSFTSVNPYNPFLGMQTAITRKGKYLEDPLHPVESLTREQAIQFYTIQNARIMGLESQIGSLEVGKKADFVVLNQDILTCPATDIHRTTCLQTWVDGKKVFSVK